MNLWCANDERRNHEGHEEREAGLFAGLLDNLSMIAATIFCWPAS